MLTPLPEAAAQQLPARDPSPSTTIGAGVVRGRVVADATDSPLVRARIFLRPDGAPALEPVFTDADGRFVFEDLPSAHYTLTITKTGYVWGKVGTSEVDRSVGLELGTRATVNLDARMVKAGAISGRIVDDLGEPVLAVNVLVGTIQRVSGQPRFQILRAAWTDDRGDFRIGGLAAGTYILAVAPDLAGTPLPGAPVEWRRNISWPQTYYPSTTDLSSAQHITLKAGEERTSTDVMLRPAAGVSGRFLFTVTDEAGQPAAGRVRLMGDHYDQTVRIREGLATTQPLSAGTWNIVAQGDAGVATATVSLDSGDVDLPLTLGRGGRISGRIVLDDGRAFDPGRYPLTVELTFNDRRTTASTVAPTALRPDGTFQFENLFGRADFTLVNQPLPPPLRASFKSITHEGRNLLDEGIEFRGGEELAEVRIVISPQPLELSGSMRDKEGLPVVGCFAAIFPEDPQAFKTGRLSRRVRSDIDGRFRFAGLPAGPYYVAAARQLDSLDWAAPDNLDHLRARAFPVVLAAGVKSDMTLECPEQ